jgi:thioredoxin-related protein
MISRVSWLESHYVIESDSKIVEDLTKIKNSTKASLLVFKQETCKFKELYDLSKVICMHPADLSKIYEKLESTQVEV